MRIKWAFSAMIGERPRGDINDKRVNALGDSQTEEGARSLYI